MGREGDRHEEVRQGRTAGTFQHEISHFDRKLIFDHIVPTTLTTCERYDIHHREAFEREIELCVGRDGS